MKVIYIAQLLQTGRGKDILLPFTGHMQNSID